MILELLLVRILMSLLRVSVLQATCCNPKTLSSKHRSSYLLCMSCWVVPLGLH